LHYFTWSKDGQLLPDKSLRSAATSRFAIQSDFSLHVENVTEDDDGVYSCTIQSEPSVTTSYVVHVAGELIGERKPPDVDILPEHGRYTCQLVR
jgi:Immunoglobulin V-set domain